MSKEFEAKLAEALRRRLLHEDRRPSEGIWYWVYLKPDWELRVFKNTEYGDFLTHVDVWEDYIAPLLAEHYNVSLKSLINIPYAMPRGRVVKRKDGTWFLYHGNDAPGGLAKWKKKIIHAFNLEGQVGLINWDVDDHEKMLTVDKQAFKALID